LPPLAPRLHQRVLDAGGGAVAREDGASVGCSEAFRLVGIERVDSLVSAIRICAAEVKTPATRSGTDERRTLYTLRAELGLLEGSDGGKPLAVLRACDHGLGVAVVAVAEAARVAAAPLGSGNPHEESRGPAAMEASSVVTRGSSRSAAPGCASR
jgi:hypothetical protein